MVDGVVQGEQGGLLAAAGGGGGGEAAVGLVGRLALRAQAAEGVDELLQLAGDVAEPGRGAEDVGVGVTDGSAQVATDTPREN